MFVCQNCERYLRDGSTACPFCDARVTSAATPAEPPKATRLSRAAAHAVRAAIIAAPAVVACGGTAEDGSRADRNGGDNSSDASGGAPDDDAMASSGGQVDQGSGGFNLGDGDGDGDVAEGGQGGEPFVGVPIYGGPFPDMMRAKV